MLLTCGGVDGSATRSVRDARNFFEATCSAGTGIGSAWLVGGGGERARRDAPLKRSFVLLQSRLVRWTARCCA